MPFEKGNKLGSRAKLFIKEINKAFERDRTMLPKIVETYLQKCLEGEPWAVCDLINRLDGKPHQTVAATVEHIVETGDEYTIAERIAAALRARAGPTVQ